MYYIHLNVLFEKEYNSISILIGCASKIDKMLREWKRRKPGSN